MTPSRFSLVGHLEVNADNGGGHLLAYLGPGFQIEFDVSFEPEWEEDCALEGFLVSVSSTLIGSVTLSSSQHGASPCMSGPAVALLSLQTVQTVQTGVGWEVLWCRLQGHFLYFWSYPEEVTQRKVGWRVSVNVGRMMG